jgi:YD repeat-containing protein
VPNLDSRTGRGSNLPPLKAEETAPPSIDRLSQQSLPATPSPVTTAWSFDTAGFLTSFTSLRNGTTLDSHTYLRDAVGNITQEMLTGASNSTSTFGYDDLYRLTSATVAGTGYSWSYDPVGNRTSQTVGGVNTTYTVDAADHLLTVNGAAVSSDANGTVTQDDTGGLSRAPRPRRSAPVAGGGLWLGCSGAAECGLAARGPSRGSGGLGTAGTGSAAAVEAPGARSPRRLRSDL